jgi:MFS family permease
VSAADRTTQVTSDAPDREPPLDAPASEPAGRNGHATGPGATPPDTPPSDVPDSAVIGTLDHGLRAATTTRRFRTFDALIEVPAFRWYMLSMLGNWSAMQMQQVVRGYIAFIITGSFAALGGVALANALPRLVFALAGGVVADRFSRRHVMQVGQVFNVILTAVIAYLLFSDQLRFEHLLIAAVLQGISMSFTMPARQAMIADLVGNDRLTNAIGLNAAGMNTMRLLAPALAGFILAFAGGGWAYVLMSALFALAVFAMYRVPARPRPPEAAGTPVPAPARRAAGGRRGSSGWRDLVEGLRYLRRNRILMMLLTVHLFVVVLSLTFQRLAPGFVSEVLAVTEQQAAWRLGVILTVMGGGALLGSLVIASLPNRRRGQLLIASIVVFGVALLVFAISRNFWFSIPIAFVLGLGQAGRQSLSQILIQTHVENEYRGRISSIMMMEMSLEAFGTFAIALVAVAWGAQVAFGSVAVALLLVAFFVAVFMPSYRRLQ